MAFYRETIYTAIVWFSVCQTVWSQSGCSYDQYVQPGSQYRVNNPNFPWRYSGGSNCSWYFSSQSGHHVKANCSHVEMPSVGSNCRDYLAVSTTGDMRDAKKYCTSFVEKGPVIRMQFFSEMWSWGGIFSCDFTSEKAPTGRPNRTEICNCGWSYTSRIVGGITTGINEFPSMALILSVPKRMQWCGATIIDRRIALTAAHCFYGDSDPNNYGLLVGEHDLTIRSETNATKLLKVSQLIIHDRYMPKEGGNDIALIITSENIVYSFRVGPACLPFNIDKETMMRQYVTATGWGTIEYGGPLSDVLQKVRLQIVPDSNCEADYPKTYNSTLHLCTYRPGKDACQFDSGGPLYYYNYLNDRFTVVGIVSSGIQCAYKYPSVNIYVHHYIPWIQQMLPDVQFCNR